MTTNDLLEMHFVMKEFRKAWDLYEKSCPISCLSFSEAISWFPLSFMELWASVSVLIESIEGQLQFCTIISFLLGVSFQIWKEADVTQGCQ